MNIMIKSANVSEEQALVITGYLGDLGSQTTLVTASGTKISNWAKLFSTLSLAKSKYKTMKKHSKPKKD